MKRKSADILPKPKKQKPINVEEFVKLAEKVKKSFDKQREYLEQEKREYPHYYSDELFQFS